MSECERQVSGADQDGATARQLCPDSTGQPKVILSGRGVAVAECQWMSNDAHRTAVDALQLAGALHSAQVAPDGLLRDSKSICNVYNVHPPFGGQEVTDRLEASRACALWTVARTTASELRSVRMSQVHPRTR